MPGNLLKEVVREVGVEKGPLDIRYSKAVIEEFVCGSALMQRCRAEGDDSFDMHRLVRMFDLLDMEEGSSKTFGLCVEHRTESNHSYVVHFLKQAGKDFYDEPDRNKHRQLELLPHTLAIMFHREELGCTTLERENRRIYHFTWMRLNWNGRFTEAKAVYLALLKIQYAIHGQDACNVDIALSLSELGIVYRNEGNVDKAEKMYDKSLDMYSAIHGSENPHPNVAKLYDQLGVVYHNQGRLEQAKEMHDRSLKMRLAMYGTRTAHSDVASSYHHLGTVNLAQRNVKGAETN